MAKPVLISGIQPTGKLHIGNYLGALKHFVELQNSKKPEYECYFFIADLHALTGNQKPEELKYNSVNLAIDYLAAGLDPKKSTLFIQSHVSAHEELTWILNTITPMGELSRITQFKAKAFKELSDKHIEISSYGDHFKVREKKFNSLDAIYAKFSNASLFDYPVLMTADILLYNTIKVPVGDDQLQHLELARTLARKFNNKFGKTFIEPQPLITNASRIMSFNDPQRKMSKSNPEGCLFLDDAPEIIKKKIMRAVTDSGNEVRAEIEGKEGIGNLMLIYSAFSDAPAHAIEKKYKGKGYGTFKKNLAEIVIKALTPFQKKKIALMKSPSATLKAFAAGNKKANLIAAKKLSEVKKKIGLI